jgi:hypothetical protein
MRLADDKLELLRVNYGDVADAALLEYWVDDVVGETGRIDCAGDAAVRQALSRLDVSLEYERDLWYDGETRLVEDQLVVYLRPNLIPSREKFTTAHELGHAALFRMAPRLDQSDTGIERLCNLFAAELLVPRRLVKREANRGSHAQAVVSLSRRSGSSLSSTCIRISECLGVAAGFAANDGTILREYGDQSQSHRIAEWLLNISQQRKSTASLSRRLTDNLMLDVVVTESKYVYATRVVFQSG